MSQFKGLHTGTQMISRLIRRQSQKAGLPPGSVVYTGEQKIEAVRLTVLDYDQVQFQEQSLDTIEEAVAFKTTPTVSWINIDGLHDVFVIDTAETYRDLVAGMLDMYMSSLSNRMNRVMQVLTITATIFIPLTFVAGIYGMNFKHMPELEWQYGYAAIWTLMLTLGIGMVIFFKHKKWL